AVLGLLTGSVAISTGSVSADNGGVAGAQSNNADRPQIFMRLRGGACHHNCGGGSGNNLYYHGGTNGVGVETGVDQVYLIYWGSQWTNNDPSGEAAIQQSFFSGVGGSSWNNSVTQYCEGVVTGTVTCGSSGT